MSENVFRQILITTNMCVKVKTHMEELIWKIKLEFHEYLNIHITGMDILHISISDSTRT